eukprot:6601841-Pyramimonas_sp.AAC.1
MSQVREEVASDSMELLMREGLDAGIRTVSPDRVPRRRWQRRHRLGPRRTPTRRNNWRRSSKRSPRQCRRKPSSIRLGRHHHQRTNIRRTS